MQTNKSLFEKFEKEDLRTSLAAILHRNSPKWLRKSRAILRNREDAEDALSEAIHRMLKRGKSFSSPDHMRMYMSRIVSNTAVELYKGRQRERSKYAPVLDDLIAKTSLKHANAFRPDLIMEEEEGYAEHENRLRLLRRGLEELPVHQYEAIRLTVLSDGGRTFQEAEAVCGIPGTTLRYRYHQGMRALRKYIERESRRGARHKGFVE